MPDSDQSFQLIRDALKALQKSIDSLDEKLDSRIDNLTEKLDTRMGKVDGRVRKLEFWRSGICAVGTAISLALGAAFKWLDK